MWRVDPMEWAPISAVASSAVSMKKRNDWERVRLSTQFPISHWTNKVVRRSNSVIQQHLFSPAVNPFLSIILDLISPPAPVHRAGIVPPTVDGVINSGRLSVHATSQLTSSGRPHTKSFLSVIRLALAETDPEVNDSGVSFWRIVTKNPANWMRSAEDTLIQVNGCACHASLMSNNVLRGRSRKLFSGSSLSLLVDMHVIDKMISFHVYNIKVKMGWIKQNYYSTDRMGGWFSKHPLAPPTPVVWSNVPASWNAILNHWEISPRLAFTNVSMISMRISTSHFSGIFEGLSHGQMIGVDVDGCGVGLAMHVPTGS